MAQKTECYAGASDFIAFLDRSDSFHALFRRLFAEPPPLTAWTGPPWSFKRS
jgi:hypothetical protein